MNSIKRAQNLQWMTLVYFIFGQLLLSIILSLLDINLSFVASIFLSQYGFIGTVLLAYMVLTQSEIIPTFHLKKLPILEGLMAIALAWTIMPLLSLINILSQFFVTNQIQDAMYEAMSLPFLVSLFLIGVTPAVLEELLTRSLILSNFKQQPLWLACLASGLFFGFVHLNINQFLYAFVMGVVMCFLVAVTGSIFTSMLIHFTINATGITMLYLVQFILSFFDEEGDLFTQYMGNTAATPQELAISAFMMLVMSAFFLPVAFLLIQALLKRHGKTFKAAFTLNTEDFMNPKVPQVFTLEDSKPLSEPEPKIGDHLKSLFFTTRFLAAALLFLIFSIVTEVLM